MGGAVSMGIRNEVYNALKQRAAMDRIGEPFVLTVHGWTFHTTRISVKPATYSITGLLRGGFCCLETFQLTL